MFNRSVVFRACLAIVALVPVTEALAQESTRAARIRNPYFSQPVWKLWHQSDEPVDYASMTQHSRQAKVRTEQFAPPSEADRQYPDFADRGEGPARLPALRGFETPPEDAAGFWDDCYATMDFAHSNIRTSVSDGVSHLNLRGQFIHVNYGMAPAKSRADLGVNFTSQSFARRGRHIVDDEQANLETEKVYFFMNCVRGTPSHASFHDNDPDAVHDDYDGLFGHSYQSVGQSSSEVYALTKMLVAGGCMPRRTKNLLKLHGAYASAALTLFKSNLPYVDEAGEPVPYESELRHRPAYASSGDVPHPHYARANLNYHGYRDALHVGAMVEAAHAMELAPPVAIVKLLNISVRKDGRQIVARRSRDDRIKSVNKTLVRVWGNEGEAVQLLVDLRDSYDLQGRALSFAVQPVYFNQTNVSIDVVRKGVYRVTCTHDPKLPKGRIPIIAVARNGSGMPSNPVFINFYWPQENERSDWSHFGRGRGNDGLRQYPVTRNQRPRITIDLPGDTLWAEAGSEAKFTYAATDPEGYSVRFYRWAGDVGITSEGVFRWAVPKDAQGSVHGVHLIASDGTGGFASRRVKIIAADPPSSLAEEWSATAIGYPASIGLLKQDGDRFEMQCAAGGLDVRHDEGLFAYQSAVGDFDMTCDIDSLPGGAQAGLSLRRGLEDKGPFVNLYMGAADLSRVWMQGRPGHSPWASLRAERELPAEVKQLRLVRRGDQVIGYASADGKRWRQLGRIKLDGDRLTYLGPVTSGVGSDGAMVQSVLRVKAMSQTPLVRITVKGEGKANRDGSWNGQATVTLEADGEQAIHYTLDGEDVGESAAVYGKPITLKPGEYTIVARTAESETSVAMSVSVKSDSKGE